VGRELARLLGYAFVDTDDEIVRQLGCSIAASVNKHGWQPFRDAEERVLEQCCSLERTVVATGGGAVCHVVQWRRLRTQALVVWLRADEAVIRDRLQGDSKTAALRPPLHGDDTGDEVARLLAERTPLYRAGSDLVLDTGERTPLELAAIIGELVRGT
jgi:shikimate kinase